MSQTYLQSQCFILVLSLLLLVVPTLTSKCESYDDFLRGCGRANDINVSDQYVARKARYEALCQENEDSNAQNKGYTLDVNCNSSDLFEEEYQGRCNDIQRS